MTVWLVAIACYNFGMHMTSFIKSIIHSHFVNFHYITKVSYSNLSWEGELHIVYPGGEGVDSVHGRWL